jgi:hypothetical protein
MQPIELFESRIAPASWMRSSRMAPDAVTLHMPPPSRSRAPKGVFSRLGQCDPSRVHRADGILIRAGHAFVGSAPPRLRDGSNSTPGSGALVARKIVL